MYELTITDSSCDARDVQTLLFKTERAAAGHAARRGDLYGMKQYRISGKLVDLATANPDDAEAPCGCKLFGKTMLYQNSPGRVPTNPGTYAKGAL